MTKPLPATVAVQIAGAALEALLAGQALPKAGSLASQALVWALSDIADRKDPEQKRQFGVVAYHALVVAARAGLEGERALLAAAQPARDDSTGGAG